MHLRTALRTGLETLLQHQVPSAQLGAEVLLMHVLGCDRAFLHSNAETEISPEKAERYFLLIEERSTGKPTQYITGHQEFWGLDFEVNPDVLIPRPETEHTVERVLELARRSGFPKEARLRIVDVGTGSGCIALALASELPRAILFGADISRLALVVASQNAVRLGMPERVKFLESDLLARFLDKDFMGTFDFVVSNPPYVGEGDIEMVQREVRQFEPRIAWGNLEQGNEIYIRLFPQALQALKPGGFVVVEIGYNMREQVLALLGPEWTEIEVMPDLAGIPRVVSARKPGLGARGWVVDKMMQCIRSYRDLEVWRKAMELAEKCYELTAGFPNREVYGLASQIRRAAVSIASNIAEGHSRRTRQAYLNHLSIALGSQSEVETQIDLSYRLGFISKDQAEGVLLLAGQVGRMLHALLAALERKGN